MCLLPILDLDAGSLPVLLKFMDVHYILTTSFTILITIFFINLSDSLRLTLRSIDIYREGNKTSTHTGFDQAKSTPVTGVIWTNSPFIPGTSLA